MGKINFNLCYWISSLLMRIVDIAKYICNIENHDLY